jgi:lipopolysaccharide/colanic/teichoic acid biosynthesis glycosyltransferase
VLLSPLFLAVAVAIKLGDRGPVFFRQKRVGLGGASFHVWKFRSMTHGADTKIEEARQTARQEHHDFFKSAADSRVTPIGRLIRRTSIDELPQLFNVLAGHMSIVGPRPLVPGEGAEVGNFLERRMLVRPGITGLWQVSGRSDLRPEERIRMDFYYVENWSVAGDLVIMVRTVRAVFSQHGAY